MEVPDESSTALGQWNAPTLTRMGIGGSTLGGAFRADYESGFMIKSSS